MSRPASLCKAVWQGQRGAGFITNGPPAPAQSTLAEVTQAGATFEQDRQLFPLCLAFSLRFRQIWPDSRFPSLRAQLYGQQFSTGLNSYLVASWVHRADWMDGLTEEMWQIQSRSWIAIRYLAHTSRVASPLRSRRHEFALLTAHKNLHRPHINLSTSNQ